MKNVSLQKRHVKRSTRGIGRFNKVFNRILQFLKSFLLPLSFAVFPSLFHYGNNLTIVLLPSLERMLLFNALLALVMYGIIYILLKARPVETANATFIFLIFFNAYGVVYNHLLPLDIVQVERYTLLPLFVLIAAYAAWLITKISVVYSIRFWNGAIFILSMLIIFNLIKIIPAEIEKGQRVDTNVSAPVDGNLTVDQGYPDIYYIIFDEFAGFEAMRGYWHNQDVDSFVQFLESKGFFVAEKSHGSSRDTLHQMATRLNYQNYPLGHDYVETYYEDIDDNRVMRYLKSLGYSTVVFDETRASFAYPAKPPIKADYTYEYDPNAATDLGNLFDDFGILVAHNTMLQAFSKLYTLDNPTLVQHRNMIYFTMNKVAELNEVHSPKFVYVHLMLPHMPFMFDANGNSIDPKFHKNWNYYLGNYMYAIRVAESMVDNILSQADPERPPVIILQSDHGARNKKTGSPDSVILENYPEEYKTNILFALYMPGYDTSSLPQDVDPINTFPIVFNYLFNANIPLK